jgi:hypothetical protein
MFMSEPEDRGLLFLVDRFGVGSAIRPMGEGNECQCSQDDRYKQIDQSWAATFSRQHDLLGCFF